MGADDWAILIGISRYDIGNNLSAAVRDAMGMRKWLTDTNGANLPKKNIAMALSPMEKSEVTGLSSLQDNEVPASLEDTYYKADSNGIIKAIKTLAQICNGRGNRLYFFYSGHGLNSPQDFRYVDALIASNTTADFPDMAISLDDVRNYLRILAFKEQFFFIDACRDNPFKFDIRIRTWPTPRLSGQSNMPQFVFHGTSPGEKSYDAGGASTNNFSVFTDALLKGLSGSGNAKRWDVEEKQYLVRSDSLLTFVFDQVSEQMKKAGRLQEPKLQLVEFSPTVNDILAKFSAGAFDKEELVVELLPAGIAAEAGVIVRDIEGLDEKVEPITNPPAKFRLAPKQYGVLSRAKGYIPATETVELYGSIHLKLELVPGTSKGTTSKGFGKATLVVKALDGLALLEIANSGGRVLKSGFGRILANLDRGFYRIRLRTPENRVNEKLIELNAGEQLEIEIDGPPPLNSRLVDEVTNHAGFHLLHNNALDISDGVVDPLMPARITTILTLAGRVDAYSETEFKAASLRSLGVNSFRNVSGAKCGFQVLFATEKGAKQDAREFFSALRMRFWLQDSPIPSETKTLVPHPQIDGLGELAFASGPGAYWFSVELPDTPHSIFSTSLIDDRITMLVIHQDLEGKFSLFQHQPSLAHPESPLSKPANLRRLELMQQYYVNGRLDYASQIGGQEHSDLLFGKLEEPLAGCLASYLQLGRGRPEVLDMAVIDMVNSFDVLSDGHILMGYRERRNENDDKARTAFRLALDTGAPVFSDGLAILLDGIEHYKIEHPRTSRMHEIYNKRYRGSIWTSWMPAESNIGEILEK